MEKSLYSILLCEWMLERTDLLNGNYDFVELMIFVLSYLSLAMSLQPSPDSEEWARCLGASCLNYVSEPHL